jgi:hypothetical protein
MGLVLNIARHVDVDAVMNDVAYKTVLEQREIEALQQRGANAHRVGLTQRLVGGRFSPVELQEHQYLVAKGQQPIRHPRFLELDAVGRDVDLLHAHVGVKKGQHFPELRMQGGLAANELNGLEVALEGKKSVDVSAECIHRQDPVAFGIRIADAARKIACIGDFDEYRAGLVGALAA